MRSITDNLQSVKSEPETVNDGATRGTLPGTMLDREVTESQSIAESEIRPYLHRIGYIELYPHYARKGILHALSVYQVCREVDIAGKMHSDRVDMIERCKELGLGSQSTIEHWVPDGNNILWDPPLRFHGDGVIHYYGPDTIMKILNRGYQQFEARVMPADCLQRGIDYFEGCYLGVYLSYRQGLPIGGDRLQAETGITRGIHRRLAKKAGFLKGTPNVAERYFNKAKDNLTEARRKAWFPMRGNIYQRRGNSYPLFERLPIVLDGAQKSAMFEDCRPGYYCHNEDEAKDHFRDRRQYHYYLVPHPDNKTVTFKDTEHTVWVPGELSLTRKPIRTRIPTEHHTQSWMMADPIHIWRGPDNPYLPTPIEV